MEFALVLPILVVILVGIIEYGSVFNAQLQLTGAAREGIRDMAINGNVSQAQAVAIAAAPGLAPALSPANVTFSSSSCTTGTNETITISYTHPFLTGMFGASLPLSAVATRRCGG